MNHYMKEGWKVLSQHGFSITVLFIYRLVWGIILFRFVESVVIPLLHRYPDGLSEFATRLFWAESQFQLMKTDIAEPYLWGIAGLLLVRMFITPLLYSGLYYSIQDEERKKRKSFITGIRRMGKVFIAYYWCQMLLTFAPLYWLIPRISSQIGAKHTYASLLLSIGPWVLAFIVYGAFINLLFIYLQIGKVSRRATLYSLLLVLRYLLPIIGLASLLFLITGLVAATAITISMIWAGFFAIILHQAYQFAKTIFKIWVLTTHYQFWIAKSKS